MVDSGRMLHVLYSCSACCGVVFQVGVHRKDQCTVWVHGVVMKLVFIFADGCAEGRSSTYSKLLG